MSAVRLMMPRCRRYNDGLVVVIRGIDGRRLETTCTCPRGLERAQDELREKLLAAFMETAKERRE